MKRIALWGGWSRNYGDLCINVAMKQMFRKASKEPLDFIDINSDLTYDPQGFRNYLAPHLSRELIQEVNETCSMLVVGGGGQIMSRELKDSYSGWQFNVHQDDLKGLKVPAIVYGVGYNRFPREQDFFYKFNSSIASVYDSAALFSVRNTGTAQIVYSCIGEDKPIYLISDPATFIDGKTLHIQGLGDKPVLGLNWAGDAPEKRFKGFEEQDLFMSTVEFCKRWVKDTGGQVLYIPHLMYYDFDKFDSFRAHLGDDLIGLHDACPWLYPESLLATPLFVGAYKACTAVLGMRGHANIVPWGQGVPAYGYGSQDKVKFFQEEVGGISLGMEPMAHYTTVMNAVFKNKEETLKQMAEKRAELFKHTDIFNQMTLAHL
jgi:polysaccharide pyruvyl transferase WcaK-like protein